MKSESSSLIRNKCVTSIKEKALYFYPADIYMGPIMSLALDRRGIQIDSKNIDNSRVMVQFKFPLNEIAVDFYDALKSLSSGYASFDYEESGFEASDIVKVCPVLFDRSAASVYDSTL